MMGPIGCFLSLILGALLFVVALVIVVLSKIASALGINIPWSKWFKIQTFGNQPFGGQPFGSTTQQPSNQQAEHSIPKSSKYNSDEGEYVEFEEIKE